MKGVIFFLLLAVARLHAESFVVSCSCGGGEKENKAVPQESKTVVIVVEKHHHRLRVGRKTLRGVAYPFRAFGIGVYYIVQGPRMFAELLAFGRIGESFAKRPSPYPIPPL